MFVGRVEVGADSVRDGEFGCVVTFVCCCSCGWAVVASDVRAEIGLGERNSRDGRHEMREEGVE